MSTDHAATCPTCGQALPALTPQQQQIAGMLAEDPPPPRQQIAEALGCSLSTVDRVARLVQEPAQRGRPRKSAAR